MSQCPTCKTTTDLVSHSGKCVSCTKEAARWRHIKATYGMSKSDYTALFEKQNGKCGICGKNDETNSQKSNLSVDHDHDPTCKRGTRAKGNIRGLLCNDCNSAIGLFQDSVPILRQAIAYLEQHIKQSTTQLS